MPDQRDVSAHRERSYEVAVRITVNDPDVIERVTGPGGDEWRSVAYSLHTENDVIDHLARNAIANGVERVNRLDGWADLSDDAATMVVLNIERSILDA